MSDRVLRVQEQVACPVSLPLPCEFSGYDVHCDGCNGDGTRWVTVGTLQQPESVFENFVADDGLPAARVRSDLYVDEENP